MATADVIFHPARLRIIQALVGRDLTPQQMGEALPDIPPASLYRHVNKLLQAGVLAVVQERQVRGTVERVYSLREEAASLTAADLADASREEQVRYFSVFLATLLGDFKRYLRREKIDLEADGVGYRSVALWLSDEEFKRVTADLNAVITSVSGNQARPGRVRRLLARIIMPADDEPRDFPPERGQ